MLCIIALLLLLTKSNSPCKACSHLRKAFLPAHILFHWKVWGPSQGNHASVMRKHAIPTQLSLSFGSLLVYNFLRLLGTVQLDITGSSVSVCHSAWPADFSLSRLWLATSSNWISGWRAQSRQTKASSSFSIVHWPNFKVPLSGSC